MPRLQPDLLNLDQDAQDFAESIAARIKFRVAVFLWIAGPVLVLGVLYLLWII